MVKCLTRQNFELARRLYQHLRVIEEGCWRGMGGWLIRSWTEMKQKGFEVPGCLLGILNSKKVLQNQKENQVAIQRGLYIRNVSKNCKYCSIQSFRFWFLGFLYSIFCIYHRDISSYKIQAYEVYNNYFKKDGTKKLRKQQYVLKNISKSRLKKQLSIYKVLIKQG